MASSVNSSHSAHDIYIQYCHPSIAQIVNNDSLIQIHNKITFDGLELW